MSAVGAAVVAVTGTFAAVAPGIVGMAVLGAVFAASALRLPNWARQRRQQMDGIADRLAATTESKPGSRAPLPD